MPNLVELAGNLYRSVKAKYLGIWYEALILENDYQANKVNKKRKLRLPGVYDRKDLDQQLLDLWSSKVKAIGYCEKCHKAKDQVQLHAHHIIPRKHKPMRWEVENGICLCYNCHLNWAHKNALEFNEWIREKRGSEFIDKLLYRSKLSTKFSASDMEILLKELQNE